MGWRERQREREREKETETETGWLLIIWGVGQTVVNPRSIFVLLLPRLCFLKLVRVGILSLEILSILLYIQNWNYNEFQKLAYPLKGSEYSQIVILQQAKPEVGLALAWLYCQWDTEFGPANHPTLLFRWSHHCYSKSHLQQPLTSLAPCSKRPDQKTQGNLNSEPRIVVTCSKWILSRSEQDYGYS